MSWSLNIVNGDLNLGGPKGLSVVTGVDKLLQDLRHRFLTDKGTDPFHPDFGSQLDEAFDGSSYSSPYIGSSISPASMLAIEAEIRSMLTQYQKEQIDKMTYERSVYGTTTIDQSEMLYAITDINLTTVDTTVVVSVAIRTATGQTFSIVEPIGTTL